MRLRVALITAALLGLAVTPALAATSEAPANQTSGAGATTATPKTPDGKDPNEIICKRAEVTGTRLGGPKECHPRRDWEQIAQEARESMDDMQIRGDTKPFKGQ